MPGSDSIFDSSGQFSDPNNTSLNHNASFNKVQLAEQVQYAGKPHCFSF
jgi:hypothetical protein